METDQIIVYRYRWVVLGAFMLVAITNQLLWITFAAITGAAAKYYAVTDLSIGLLSMVFMIVYIFVSIPASYAIDTYGIRRAVGIGAVLTGVFGLLRGLAAANYTLVLISQVGIAIGQPFILNAITTVSARWFPLRERATAAGLGSLATYLGIFTGLALTPYLALHIQIGGMLLAYGIAALLVAILFFALAKERPATPPSPPGMETRSLAFSGLREMLRQPSMLLLLAIFFIGLGAFNAVTTWIEDILRPRGFSSTQAGVIGGLMIAGGIVGALVIPGLSDRYRRRIPFIILALAGTALGLAGITFATSYALLLASAFAMGFFLLSAGPIGFQYGAEITYPIPEGTSNGMLLLMGQISGIIFIFAMDAFKSPLSGEMTSSLVALTLLLGLCLILAARLKEPQTLLSS